MLQLIKDESGATAIEYALIASFIGMSIVTALSLVGVKLTSVFTAVSNAFVF